MSVDHLPQTLKPLGAADPAKTQGEIRVPWETLPCSDFGLMSSAEASLDAVWDVVWNGLVSSGRFCCLLISFPGLVPSTRTGQGDQGSTHFSAEEGEGSHSAHGTWEAAPLPQGWQLPPPAPGPGGCGARSPQPGTASPRGPRLALTPLLAGSTCCWCRNTPAHGSGAAFGRCS